MTRCVRALGPSARLKAVDVDIRCSRARVPAHVHTVRHEGPNHTSCVGFGHGGDELGAQPGEVAVDQSGKADSFRARANLTLDELAHAGHNRDRRRRRSRRRENGDSATRRRGAAKHTTRHVAVIDLSM